MGKDAFEQLVRQYQHDVIRIIRVYTKNDSDAEDLAQETWVKVYRSIWKLRPPYHFESWLKKIAVNTARDWLRSRAYKESQATDEILPQQLWGSAMSQYQRQKLIEEVRDAIDSLSFKNRQVVLDFYICGYSITEISQRLKIPKSTVTGRLQEARKQLRKEFASMVTQSGIQEKFASDNLVRNVMERVGRVMSVAVDDVNGDDDKEIIIGTDNGVVMAFTPSGEALWRYDSHEEVKAIATVDLNGDGKKEIIVASRGLIVLNGDGDLVRQRDEGIVHDMRVIKNKGEVEIVAVTDWLRVYAADLNVLAECHTPYEPASNSKGIHLPGVNLATGDIDGDGEYEIAVSAGDRFYLCRRNGELIWNYKSTDYGSKYQGWYVVEMFDINSDGKAEILTGHNTHLIAFSGTGDELWRVERWRPWSICAEDINADGKVEIAVGTVDSLYVINEQGRIFWECGAISTCYPSVKMVDVNGDGKKELIAIRWRYIPAVCAFSENGTLIWQYSANSDFNAFVCSDIDNDGAYEIVAGGHNLTVLSNVGEVKWIYEFDASHEVADSDGDGKRGIIADSHSVTTYSPSGTTLWHCDPGPAILVDSRIFDLFYAMNQIKDTRVFGGYQGREYLDRRFPAWVSFRCPFETAVRLLRIVQRHQEFEMKIGHRHRQISFFYDDESEEKSLSKLQANLIADFENAGLLTEKVTLPLIPRIVEAHEEVSRAGLISETIEIIDEAYRQANRFGHRYVDVEHLFLSLLKVLNKSQKPLIYHRTNILGFFTTLGLSCEHLIQLLEAQLQKLPVDEPIDRLRWLRTGRNIIERITQIIQATQPADSPKLTEEAASVFQYASAYGRERGHSIEIAHIAYGVMKYLGNVGFPIQQNRILQEYK